MAVRGRVPDIRDDDKHLLIRLGMAAVYQWDELPTDVQELLLDQACNVEIQPITVQLRQQIEAFVRRNKGAD